MLSASKVFVARSKQLTAPHWWRHHFATRFVGRTTSADAPSASATAMTNVLPEYGQEEMTFAGLEQLSEVVRNSVVGHDEVKEGLMLALIAREHAYIEGPPGTGKTFLAELLSQSAGLDFFFYQFHRDTRLNELIGDSVLVRKHDEAMGGEVVQLKTKPGGLLRSEICVLDDISRAPGEALNVLLRILNERTFQDGPIPLMSAIATANPATDEFYNEPLDPANLDRFAVQIKMPGLVEGSCWDEALALMDLYEGARREELALAPVNGDDAAGGLLAAESGPTFDVARACADPALAHGALDLAYQRMKEVRIPPRVKNLLLHLLDVVLRESKKESGGRRGSHVVMMSDRTFLIKSLKILKAKAVYHSRTEVIPSDLHAFKYLTTLRVPERVHEQMTNIIDAVLDHWHGVELVPPPTPVRQGRSQKQASPSVSVSVSSARGVPPAPDMIRRIQQNMASDHATVTAATETTQPQQSTQRNQRPRMMRDGTVFVPQGAPGSPTASSTDPKIAAWEKWNRKKVESGATHLAKRAGGVDHAASTPPTMTAIPAAPVDADAAIFDGSESSKSGTSANMRAGVSAGSGPGGEWVPSPLHCKPPPVDDDVPPEPDCDEFEAKLFQGPAYAEAVAQDGTVPPSPLHHKPPPTMEEVFENTCYGQALRNAPV